jgi:hypothetical protein
MLMLFRFIITPGLADFAPAVTSKIALDHRNS